MLYANVDWVNLYARNSRYDLLFAQSSHISANNLHMLPTDAHNSHMQREPDTMSRTPKTIARSVITRFLPRNALSAPPVLSSD